MPSLTEFWPNVPTLTDAQLKSSAVVFPNLETAEYLTGQDRIDQTGFGTTTAVLQLQDGRWFFCADLLKEFHPDTRTGNYHPDYAAIITAIGDTIQIEPWAATITKRAPDPPDDLTAPPLWVQPIPGLETQWFNKGYPFDFEVRHLIDGVELVMRSLQNFNVWPPSFDARLWEPVPPQAISWRAGQVWNIGAVVHHPVDDPAFPPAVTHWRSRINANTTQPGHDAGFYRFWEIADADFDPAVPRPFVGGRAYGLGERILEPDNVVMESLHPTNVWRPSNFPTGWKVVTSIQLVDAVRQFKWLTYQVAALRYLQEQLTVEQLEEFIRLYRNTQPGSPLARALDQQDTPQLEEVASHFQDLPHQQAAWTYLQDQLTDEQMQVLAQTYLAPPPSTEPPSGGDPAPEKTRAQELAALRRRDGGRFVANDPDTPENEAWVSGEAPE